MDKYIFLINHNITFTKKCAHINFFLQSSEINWVVQSEGKVRCNINLESRSSPTSVSGIKNESKILKGNIQ